MSIELFPREQIAGVFRGFREGGLEFHADLILPYRNEFQSIPMHGQFLLVQLETPEEAVLGRIASFSADGKLSAGAGEEFNIRAMREGRAVPEDLREQYLKYRVDIRVLGVLRQNGPAGLTFVASHRRLPHVGSPVAFPSPAVLREIAGHNLDGAQIGHLALGEYIYAQGSEDFEELEWMQVRGPEISVRFPIENLVSRRTFVFARAGFGKSNLNKLLFSRLYQQTPLVNKRGNRSVPVGTIIFDPDGEYFWPDDKGRPGLCDVPELVDKLVVFTSRRNASAYYTSFIAGGIKLDIRRLRPADVLAIALNPDRQDQQNVRKLKGLDQGRWEEIIDLIDRNGHQADIDAVCKILDLDKDKQEAEALAARSNMTTIVRMLHDRSSQLMDMLMHALAEGKLCIVDVSQMRGGQALVLSGLILRRIFDRNQEEFTAAEPRTIPTIAVVEEAQSVLVESVTAAEPYVAWVKEGRKYDLGAVLITQQPGSIPSEILSQGDNWFIFHLLSAADLANVKRANAHFSDDLLSALLNEPIPGQGVFWSSVGGKPYPVPLRALSFEKMYQTLDPNYSQPAASTYAVALRQEFAQRLSPQGTESIGSSRSDAVDGGMAEAVGGRDWTEDAPDAKEAIERLAILAFVNNATDLHTQIRGTGVPWGGVTSFLLRSLPAHVDGASDIAHNLVRKAMNEVFGAERQGGWHTFKHDHTGKTWVRAGRPR